jgi:polyribonucleotide nucleotidyltransferase
VEGPDLQFTEAVIDNGDLGRHVVRFESGLLARQAAGSATVYLDDDTMVLSATTAQARAREAIDFFPLTVDVEERMYAVGRIPGSFFRREGRPSEGAILACRLIDRPLRPCFVKGLRNEIQVIVTVMALNPNKLYDVAAINAASLSTQLAGLPFSGPVGGVRVALIDDRWVGFPDVDQLEDATFDMVVAGRVTAAGDVAIAMVEAESTEHTWDLVRSGKTAPTEEVVSAGLEAAKPFIKALCDAQVELAAMFPKPIANFPIFVDYNDDVYAAVAESATVELGEVMSIADKQKREQAADTLKSTIVERLATQFEGREKEIAGAYRALTKKLVRQRILTERIRIDGRGVTDIRTLAAEVGVVPRVHGSALFQRGETQILGVSTLNMLGMEQKLDTLAPETSKRYMHNYNFPPYSTGETGRVGSPKRREIGHGALPSAPWSRCCRRVRSSRTRSVRYRRLSAQTALLRWGRCARRPWRCSTRACRCVRRLPVLPWASSPTPWTVRPATWRLPTSSALRTLTATWTSRSRVPGTSSQRCSWIPNWTGFPPQCWEMR